MYKMVIGVNCEIFFSLYKNGQIILLSKLSATRYLKFLFVLICMFAVVISWCVDRIHVFDRFLDDFFPLNPTPHRQKL